MELEWKELTDEQKAERLNEDEYAEAFLEENSSKIDIDKYSNN